MVNSWFFWSFFCCLPFIFHNLSTIFTLWKKKRNKQLNGWVLFLVFSMTQINMNTGNKTFPNNNHKTRIRRRLGHRLWLFFPSRSPETVWFSKALLWPNEFWTPMHAPLMFLGESAWHPSCNYQYAMNPVDLYWLIFLWVQKIKHTPKS